MASSWGSASAHCPTPRTAGMALACQQFLVEAACPSHHKRCRASLGSADDEPRWRHPRRTDVRSQTDGPVRVASRARHRPVRIPPPLTAREQAATRRVASQPHTQQSDPGRGNQGRHGIGDALRMASASVRGVDVNARLRVRERVPSRGGLREAKRGLRPASWSVTRSDRLMSQRGGGTADVSRTREDPASQASTSEGAAT